MKDKCSMKIVCIVLAAVILFPTVIGNISEHANNKEIENSLKELNKKERVSFYLETSDGKKRHTNELSFDEAKSIRNQLLKIEKEYHSEEKIRKQMEVLHENDLLPESIAFDDYMNRLNTIKRVFGFDEKKLQGKNVQPQQLLNTEFIFSGPSIESTFTLGGQTYQLQLLVGDLLNYYFDIELFDYQDNDTLNGTHFHSSAYSGPVFVGISPAAAFITTIGVIISGPAFIYAPFVSIRVLFSGLHISATIFECENPISVFDWHLNIALMGVLVYQSN